jgi:phage shock protein A
MGIFSRLSKLIESNLGALVARSADPEKTMEMALKDMQESLREAKVSVARSIRDKKLLENKYEDNIAQVGYWEDKALLALKKGNEELARKAIKNKRDFECIADEYAEQLETQEKNIEMLRSSLAMLERKIADARRKKDLLVARQKHAQAEKQIHDRLAKIGNESVNDSFEKMEEKIAHMEAEANAARELSSLEDSITSHTSPLLELDEDVEDDLARMKQQLGMNPNQPARPLLLEADELTPEAEFDAKIDEIYGENQK